MSSARVNTLNIIVYLYCNAGRCISVRIIFEKVLWRCLTISKKDIQINEEIRDKELRVISSDGKQLGIMSSKEALALAEQKNLDLVKIAPQTFRLYVKLWTTANTAFEQAKRKRKQEKSACC